MTLTAKQERFVQEYLSDAKLNATQAAIRAGYSEKGATVRGAELLANRKVKEVIEERQKARSERTEITADWVLTRLHDEAEADLADIYDDDGNLLPVKEWPTIWRQGLVAGIEVEALFEGQGESKRQIGHLKKIKISDRVKRIELIGKHVSVQAFREQVEHSGGISLNVLPEDAKL